MLLPLYTYIYILSIMLLQSIHDRAEWYRTLLGQRGSATGVDCTRVQLGRSKSDMLLDIDEWHSKAHAPSAGTKNG
jgi:hypothetical protein